MYAIVDIAGQQFKVQKNDIITTQRLEDENDSSVEFDKVLLVSNDGDTKVGTPYVEGAKVTAKVVDHTRGKKVIVFKKKRRKGYKVKRGHRQAHTQLQIEDIVV